MIGRVINLLAAGYGFIKPEGSEGDKDTFFHCSSMESGSKLDFKSLVIGDQVSFELDNSRDNKPVAVKVQKIDGGDTAEEVTE